MSKNGSFAFIPLRAAAILVAILLLGVGGLSSQASAKNTTQSGPVIKAEEPTPENGYIHLQELPGLLGAPLDAEYIFLSGYRPERNQNRVRVVLDRPRRTVVLILSTYEPTVWEVEATAGTNIAHVLVGDRGNSALKSDLPLVAYRTRLPHSYEIQNASFQRVLDALYDIYGTDRVDHHFGSYSLPEIITVGSLALPDPRLSLDWPPVTETSVDFRFDLTSRDLTKSTWTASGPLSGQVSDVTIPQTTAFSPDRRTAYRIDRNGIEIVDMQSSITRSFPLPPNFSRLSWPEGIAYDSENDIVAIATSGGGGAGAFYRFDAVRERWLDYRDLDRSNGVASLSFDPVEKVYIAAHEDYPGLIVLSPEGDYLQMIDLKEVLPGIFRTYDRGNGPVPALSVIPHGRYIAILSIAGRTDRGTERGERPVSRIWLYDKRSHTAQLTYRVD